MDNKKTLTMALHVIGGIYGKDAALKVLRNMKYYSKDLKEREWMKGENGAFIGILASIMGAEEKMHEDYLVEKLLLVRSVLQKQGDYALDEYQEVTSPKPDEALDKLRTLDRRLGINIMQEMCDELSTPLTKKQFNHYLEIYNEFYGTT